MSRLSQLNKNEAHKALAALAQRQQAAAMQFDGEAGFAAILNAQSSQIETPSDRPSDKKDQHEQREPQEEPLPKRVMLGQPKKPASPTVRTSALPVKQQSQTVKEAPSSDSAQPEALPLKATVDARAAQIKSNTAEPADTKAKLQGADDDLPLIYVADAAPVASPVAPVPPSNPVNTDDVKTTLSAAGPLAAPDILVVQTPADPKDMPIAPILTSTPASPQTLPVSTNGNDLIPIALNDVLLPPKFRMLQTAGTPIIKLPTSPVQAPTTNTTASTTPVELIEDTLQPATNADITKAATIVLEQLAPVTHALAYPGNAQTSKMIMEQSPLAKLPEQTAPLPTAEPMVDISSDRQSQPVSVNPILIAVDQQPIATVNPLLNPALNIPNPALQTTITQANAAPAATGFAAANAPASTVVEAQLNSDGTVDSAAFGNHTLARYDAGALARSGRLPNTAAGAALPANAQVAIQLAKAAKNGDRAFNIQLHPAELGRVEVKLDVDSHGGATARILVDSQATLDLLQTHRPGLERALTDAGLKCDAGGISFELRDNGQNAGQSAHESHHHGHGRHGKNNAANALSGTADATLDTSIIANYTLSLQPGRIDIKA